MSRLRLPVMLLALLINGCQPGPEQDWRARIQAVPEVSLARRDPGDSKRLSELRERIEQTIARPDLSAAEAARAYAELGRQYMAHEFDRAALVAFANVVAIDPDWRTAHYLRAVMLQHQGQLADARHHLLESLRIAPDDGNTLLRLGDVALANAEPELAQEYFERAMAIAATRWSGQAGLGRVALFQRDYANAARHLGEVLEQRPQASALRHPLAQALRELGQIDAAKAQLEMAGTEPLEQTDPLVNALGELMVGARALLSRAFAAKSANDIETAERLYRQAVEADPQFVLAHSGLGQMLADMGRYEDALASFQQSVELDPAFPEGWFNLAVAHLKLDNTDAAETALRKLLELDPDHVEARYRLAGILHGRAQPEAAAGELERVLQLEATHAGALQSLIILTADANPAQARQRLEAALQQPLQATDRATLLTLRANLAASAGDPESALGDFRAATQADPDNFEAWFNLATLQLSSGAEAGAEKALLRALTLRPEHLQTRLALARTQISLGLWPAAKQTLEAGPLDLRADNENLIKLIEVLAASPDDSVRDGERALRLAEQATRETRNLRFMELTAMAAAELGQFEQAAQLIERLLQVAQSQSAPPEVEQRLRSALNSYRSGQALRMSSR